ncbi:MAG: hypothetical protein NTW21_35525 [Verrucomicrobia bacterium]|nr:hypothetical protein [Verrucomicrobiota bacterium]
MSRHVTGPTERMARICEMFGMPLTRFYAAEEYLVFERERGRKEVPSDQ